MSALPMTVIAGYLGAGKTTLINRLLAEDHGLRLLVMVNDFGPINIDASLLASRDEDTIALSNGCVCCTMGADLFMAIGDVLDRSPRPDHLIIEASGVSDPARIANAAIAEPELSYAGIVTVVDGPTFETLRQDTMIGPQIVQQVQRADLVWVSKEPNLDELATIEAVTSAPVLSDGSAAALLGLVFERDHSGGAQENAVHPQYISWVGEGDVAFDRDAIHEALAARPRGLFRLKGFIRDVSGTYLQVQVVGREISVTKIADAKQLGVVGIALKASVTKAEIEAWWAGVTDCGRRETHAEVTKDAKRNSTS